MPIGLYALQEVSDLFSPFFEMVGVLLLLGFIGGLSILAIDSDSCKISERQIFFPQVLRSLF